MPIGNGIQGYHERYEAGMDLRDYFAGQALIGMLAGTPEWAATTNDIADRCYAIADSMVRRRYHRD
jgi:hypothetical protein